jgi:hypothetical protein
MKTVRYTGLSTIREISEHEMKTAFGVTKKDGLLVDTRESRIVTVSNRLAEALVSTGEFVLFGAAPDDEDAETYGSDVIPEVPDATTDSDEDVARAQHAPAPQEPVSDGTAKTTKKPKA